MFAKVILRKLDNGFKAELVDWDTPEVVGLGTDIFNRNLKGFEAGDLVYAVVNVTPTGRRVIKKVWAKSSPLSETTLLEVRLAPAAKINGWLNAAETLAARGGARRPHASAKVLVLDDVEGEEGDDIPTLEEETKTVENVVETDPLKGYYVDEQARLVFTTAYRMSQAQPERAVKLMMVGPSGYGKTTLPRIFANLTGKRFLRMNCATVRDPEEWFGYREAVDGSTVFIRSQFAREIAQGNLVVVLDEFNRLEPWLHNTLFPLLDDDGRTVVHDETFTMGKGVVVVGTMNTGYKYTGTFELDEALFNRFDFMLEVGPMPHAEEVKVLVERTGLDEDSAHLVVKGCNLLRNSDVVASTRTSILVASMVRSGMTIREAFESAVVRRIPQESSGSGLRKQVVDMVNTEFGPFLARNLADDVFRVKDKAENAAPAAVALGSVPTLILKRHASAEYLMINTIRVLRTLTLADGTKPTLGLARSWAEELSDGKELTIQLKAQPTNLPVLVDWLKHAGLTGVYGLR